MSGSRLSRFVLIIVAVFAAAGSVTYAASQQGGGDPGPSLPPAKQAIIDRVNHARAALPNNPDAKAAYLKHPDPPPAGGSDQAPAVGILEIRQSPFPAGEYVIQNSWQRLEGDVLEQVFAGASGSDQTQDVVIDRRVLWKTGQQISVHVFSTGKHEGALRIVSLKGTQLELSSTSQQPVAFDPDLEKFVAP